MHTITAYLVYFTNWKAGNNSYYFLNKDDAQSMIDEYAIYGYKAIIETIQMTSSKVNA